METQLRIAAADAGHVRLLEASSGDEFLHRDLLVRSARGSYGGRILPWLD